MLKHSQISVRAVENGYAITVNATNEKGTGNSRELVAASEGDCKKKLHEAIDKMFEAAPAPKA